MIGLLQYDDFCILFSSSSCDFQACFKYCWVDNAIQFFSTGANGGCSCWKEACSKPLGSADGLDFYQVIPTKADSDSDGENLVTTWYKPGSSIKTDSVARDTPDDDSDDEEAPEKDEEEEDAEPHLTVLSDSLPVIINMYSIVQEASKCGDAPAAEDTTINDTDVSFECCQCYYPDSPPISKNCHHLSFYLSFHPSFFHFLTGVLRVLLHQEWADAFCQWY